MLNETIEAKNDVLDDLLQEISELTIKLGTKEMQKSGQLAQMRRRVNQEKNEERFEIMRQHEGIYHYNWKYERLTWRVATQMIFFDLGQGVLFRRVDERTLHKYSLEEFVKRYGPQGSV